MSEDIGEKNNLSEKYSEKKKELHQKLVDWIEETHAPIPTNPNPYYQKSK